MARLIHHLTFEIDKNLIVEELSFWACFGFHPTGLRRRSRKQPPVHWLVCGDEGYAVELLPGHRDEPQDLTHVCLALPLRRWEIATAELPAVARTQLEAASPHFGGQRFFAEAPSGYTIEAIQTEHNQLKAGPPLEDIGYEQNDG